MLALVFTNWVGRAGRGEGGGDGEREGDGDEELALIGHGGRFVPTSTRTKLTG